MSPGATSRQVTAPEGFACSSPSISERPSRGRAMRRSSTSSRSASAGSAPGRAATGPARGRAPRGGVGGAAAFEELVPGRGARRGVHGSTLLPLRRRRRDPRGPRGRLVHLGSRSGRVVRATPLAVDLEVLCARWLCELLELPADELTGVFVTGATAANTVGLGAARQRVLARAGHDAAERGLASAPAIHVLTSGFVHASVVKACAVLGLGRASIERFSADNRGTLDEAALARRLEELGDAPSILVGTAGEVNSGRSDPLDRLAELAEAHGAWLHVDAAFGAFARVTPRASEQVGGLERADCRRDAQGLNVPYDRGFALLRDRDGRPGPSGSARRTCPCQPASRATSCRRTSPESSRARGRAGVRDCPPPAAAPAFARWSSGIPTRRPPRRQARAAGDLELVDEPVLNVVPFRFAPEGVRRRDLDDLNEARRAVLDDGRVAGSRAPQRRVPAAGDRELAHR